MSSRAKEKEALRTARKASEQDELARHQRRRRLLWLAGIAGAAVVVLAIGIAVSQSGSDSGNLADDTAAVRQEFAGLPQDGTVLGQPKTPAKLVEYGDLQCPACAAYSNDTLPKVLDQFVRPGRLKLELRPISIIGPDSVAAAEMAAATSFQDRIWQYSDIFYRNQGIENSGYVDEAFLEKMAEATPGVDADRAVADSRSADAQALAARWVKQAQRAGVNATPTFFLERPGQAPQEVPVTSNLVATLDGLLPAQ